MKQNLDIEGRYAECIDYILSATPQFERIGAAAYKPGLDTVRQLDALFGFPSRKLKVIHVAGTNGKGSTAHSLAAVLQKSGYRTGLFTSPHLTDFRERIRIDGQMIPRADVVEFVERYRSMPESKDLHPSFFELTTVMAFDWMARSQVDFAVIEVGLGGRLDSTNIVKPLLSVITNISMDHMQQLGYTLESIAMEKGGIMKPGVPVVVGDTKTRIVELLKNQAKEVGATQFVAAAENPRRIEVSRCLNGGFDVADSEYGQFRFCLDGDYQRENIMTIVHSLAMLQQSGINITTKALTEGLGNVNELTGLRGRWEVLQKSPLVVCDTGHNEGGWEYVSCQIERLPRPLTIILGFVGDKDLTHIYNLLPRDARYIFTNSPQPRALKAERLREQMSAHGIDGEAVAPISAAVDLALADEPESVFIGGSTYVVAEAISHFDNKKRP